MNQLGMRRVGAAAALAVLGTTVGVLGSSAGAAERVQNNSSVQYTCTGKRGADGGNIVGSIGGAWVDSYTALEQLKSIFPSVQHPAQVAINVVSDTPQSFTRGSADTASFTMGAVLPSSLVSAMTGIGIYQVTATSARFGIDVVGGTPSQLAANITDRTVWLTAGASVSETVSGSVLPNAGASVVDFTAGSAEISLGFWIDTLGVRLGALELTCVPTYPRILARATVSDGPVPTQAPSTAAPSTAAPTTAAPTTAAPSTAAPSTAAPTTAAPSTAAPTTAAPSTAAPTTAAPTTAAPTTAAPTTAAPSTAAPTTAAPTTAAPTTAAPTTAAPTTEAPPATVPGTRDRVRISVGGSYSYSVDTELSTGGFWTSSDWSGLTAIGGGGTFPGRNGGTASVSVDVSRFLWWSFGSISVNDPGAGIRDLQVPILFGPGIAGDRNAASVGGSWFGWDNGFVGYSIDVTVSDVV